MQVRDIMTTNVLAVSPSDSVRRVAELICEHEISGLPVVSEGTLVGKISQSDLLHRIFPSQAEFYEDLVHGMDFDHMQTRAAQLLDRPVREVLSEEAMTVGPEEPVMKAAAWMLLRDIHRLSVVDAAGHVLGVVSRGDIFYHVLRQELAAAGAARTAQPVKS